MIRKLTLKKEREHETNEASIAGNVMRDLIAHVTNDNLIGRKIKSGELRKKMVEPPWKCPDMFTMTTIEMEHFTMEWLELKENPNEQKVILQLHGGGYIGAMRNAYRMFAGLYNEVSKGMSVLTIDYRVAPENPYPAALEDAVSAYHCGRRFRRRRACDGTVPLSERSWNAASMWDRCNVSVDGSYGKR